MYSPQMQQGYKIDMNKENFEFLGHLITESVPLGFASTRDPAVKPTELSSDLSYCCSFLLLLFILFTTGSKNQVPHENRTSVLRNSEQLFNHLSDFFSFASFSCLSFVLFTSKSTDKSKNGTNNLKMLLSCSVTEFGVSLEDQDLNPRRSAFTPNS
ncbi:uncharacterized protein V6R79_010144 [Siganus canaliculatus]